MINERYTVLALDVGDARIGVARAESDVRIAFPETTIHVDGTELTQLEKLVGRLSPRLFVVGYPRNQQGEPTEQTEKVQEFVSRLDALGVPVVYQDESLTSVHAEANLKLTKKPYTKADIDAAAAALILRDYLEQNNG